MHHILEYHRLLFSGSSNVQLSTLHLFGVVLPVVIHLLLVKMFNIIVKEALLSSVVRNILGS